MRSHIVIASPSCGGTEKRFFDVFTMLRRGRHDVVLIAPSSLVDQLKADHPQRQDVFPGLLPVEMRKWSGLGFVRRFRELLAALPRGASFHYPLNCLWPLHFGRGDVLTMSVPECAIVPGPFAGKRASVWAWLSFFFVERIDVLSPSIHSKIRRYRAAPKMSVTPGGTFLVPPDRMAAQRRPTVVFLGRLVPGKGVEEFLHLLPRIWNVLRMQAPPGMAFLIAGYGPLQERVAARVADLAAAAVPVQFVGYAVAESLLAQSAVTLSLQENTNYPSRVVAEALSAGCGVIVRDTGDSRQFGHDLPGLVYCAPDLDADELADTLARLMHRIMSDPDFVESVRDTARRRFSSLQYIDYFRGLLFGTSAHEARAMQCP